MQQSIRIFEDEAEVVYGVVQSLPPPLCAAYDGRLAAERRVVLGPVWGPWAVTGRSRPPPGVVAVPATGWPWSLSKRSPSEHRKRPPPRRVSANSLRLLILL